MMPGEISDVSDVFPAVSCSAQARSHRRYFLRILEKTFLPGTSFTSPLSIWAMRRSASSAHSRSISGCVGRLRLVSSFSTRLTRASAGSDKASSNTFFATTGIFRSSIYIYSSSFYNKNQIFLGAEWRPRIINCYKPKNMVAWLNEKQIFFVWDYFFLLTLEAL